MLKIPNGRENPAPILSACACGAAPAYVLDKHLQSTYCALDKHLQSTYCALGKRLQSTYCVLTA